MTRFGAGSRDRLDVRRVLLPKRDADERECEDAIAVARNGRAFAVVDGATEGIDSRRWARCLARAWVASEPRGAPLDDLVACARTLGDRQQARWAGKTLPWYLEEKAAQGSFAAFVGVALAPDLATWDAVAIGDSCLFVEESGVLAESFPMTSSEAFNSRPILLPSNHAAFGDFGTHVRTARGPFRRDARLLLLSDAVSAWWIDEHVRGGALVRDVHAALDRDDAGAVREIVREEREARRMRNDDVAILRVEAARGR